MKSYILEAVESADAAQLALCERLPTQKEPWVLMTEDGRDAIAYLNVQAAGQGEFEGPFAVQADISGRHHFEDQRVIETLRALQRVIGGVIRDDDDNVL